jgi:hypothetical protein
LRRKQIWLLAASFAAYLGLSKLIPEIHIFGPQLDLIVFTVLFMAVQVLVIRYVCALQMSFTAAGVIFLLSLGVFFALIEAHLKLHGPAWIDLPTDISRIVAAASLGYLVSFALRDKNIVLPISAFAAYFDIWTVTWGPTRQMVSKAPQIVQAVSASIPMPGGHGRSVSFIGPADFVFLAVFFGAIYRLKMNAVRTFWFVFPLLSISMLIVNSTDYFPNTGIPALVPMSIGIIAANYKHVKFDKQEKWSLAIVSVILALALVAYMLHRAAH